MSKNTINDDPRDTVCQSLWKKPIKSSALNDINPLPLGPSFQAYSGSIGLEVEIFAFCKETFEPFGLPHHAFGVENLLRAIHTLCPHSKLKVDELAGVSTGVNLAGGSNFSMEPGGQIEFSSRPCASLSEVALDVQQGLEILERAAEGRLLFLGTGTNPLSAHDHPLALPKERYQIMTRYFNAFPDGRGVHMMRHTATVQPNIDIPGNQADWEDAVNLVWMLTPFARHMFANSPWFQKKRSVYFSERSAIWPKVDPSRCGIPPLVPFAADPVCAYAKWARAASVFYVPGVPVGQQPLPGELSFEKWLEEGYHGIFPLLGDWETHLGTLFPDLRLRNFLEIRCVDEQPFQHMLAPAAFFVHILQRTEVRKRAWEFLLGIGRTYIDCRDPAVSLVSLVSLESAANTQGAINSESDNAVFLKLVGEDFQHPIFADKRIHRQFLKIAHEESVERGDSVGAASLLAFDSFLAAKNNEVYACEDALQFVKTYALSNPSERFVENLALNVGAANL